MPTKPTKPTEPTEPASTAPRRRPGPAPRPGRGEVPRGPFPVERVLARVREAVEAVETPSVTGVGETTEDPFQVLVACVISLRTQDEVTDAAAARLFARAADPAGVLALSEDRIARLIYPAGFYRVKACQIRAICRRLLDAFGGRVPDDLDALLTLPGVGRKTANLVLAEGYGLPAICVDTHVHRIVNRWGYVRTRTPEQTEMRLRAKLPGRWWIPINRLLVQFGRTVCRPLSPRCSECPVAGACRRVGVTRSR
jgi:endonuclease-3